MSQNHVIELANTLKQRPIVCDYAGGRFRLTSGGLTFIGIDKDCAPSPPWIYAPLHVVAKTRDAQSGEWGRLPE
ncbi:inner membrane protein [Legionella moravica]|uniref:Inner membrane protein n=1 Tax=Legionella moravica TaxID=39962 RepID=A0A378JSS1_9GAMM|nr:inner membrane protein [Legionella moravica]STX61654.1 inner membrane protein [Legionella moravica]